MKVPPVLIVVEHNEAGDVIGSRSILNPEDKNVYLAFITNYLFNSVTYISTLFLMFLEMYLKIFKF